MNTDRILFVQFFFREISGLNYAYLNYIDDDRSFFSAHTSAELLIDRDDYDSLVYVLTSFPKIKYLRIKKDFSCEFLELQFSDNTRYLIKLSIELFYKGYHLLSSREALNNIKKSPEGIRYLSEAHRFEYFFLKSMLGRQDVPEEYRSVFGSMNMQDRSRIFAHIIPRYRFVIHVLDELFSYQSRYLLKVISALRKNKMNRGIRFAFHRIQYFMFRLRHRIFKSWSRLEYHRSSEQDQLSHQDKGSFLRKKYPAKAQ